MHKKLYLNFSSVDKFAKINLLLQRNESGVKKHFSFLIVLLIFSGIVSAKTIYVTDHIKFTLRSSPNNRSKIVKMVPSGTPLTILEDNAASGYSKVRTGGVEGYILTRHTLKKPISRWYLDKANKKLETLQTENTRLNEELKALKGNNSSALQSNQSLTQERDSLSRELNELKQTAAEAIQLKHQNNQLLEKRVETERELEQLKLDNQALRDSANQDWFLYGGILSLFGVLMGFILPKLSWRRKTSNWDTF